MIKDTRVKHIFLNEKGKKYLMKFSIYKKKGFIMHYLIQVQRK